MKSALVLFLAYATVSIQLTMLRTAVSFRWLSLLLVILMLLLLYGLPRVSMFFALASGVMFDVNSLYVGPSSLILVTLASCGAWMHVYWLPRQTFYADAALTSVIVVLYYVLIILVNQMGYRGILYHMNAAFIFEVAVAALYTIILVLLIRGAVTLLKALLNRTPYAK